ncbi:uncharacterized protein LOC142548950 [Primulina tabacum]|uniref:uncharacterized protein LOC142548950 n=1 Tax=Primulina tabacum TaxID=48773 RepID=UPI003F5A4778
MGWSVKQDVSVSGGVGWSHILLQSGAAAELVKPPLMRRQQQPEFLKCPRCGSTNTKFCYYNNYNKSQPRYFCKACKRHWTKGGTLRNVPVGGGRKSKRPKKSTSAIPISSSSSSAATPQHRYLPNFPFASTTNDPDQKIMSSTLYHTLSRSSSPMLRDIQKTSMVDENGPNNTPNSNVTASQIENAECPFSSLGIFDLNSCLNVYQDHYTWNLDSAAESTITSVNNPTMSSSVQIVESCSDTMDLANDWNWNEIDGLVSPDRFKYIMG